MTLMQYKWIFPDLKDSLHQIIASYKNPEELKEKIFYLSKFLNKDVLKMLCIMLHRITYVFDNDIEYALEITNNKHQLELIPQKNIYNDFDSYSKNIIDKNNHDNCIILGNLSCFYANFFSSKYGINYFVGFCIDDDIDVSKIQIKSENGLSVNLDKALCKIGKYNLFKVNIPLYILDSWFTGSRGRCWIISSPYTVDTIVQKIKVCYLSYKFLSLNPPCFVIKMNDSFHVFNRGSFTIVKFDDGSIDQLLKEYNIDDSQMPIGKVFLLKK